MMMIMHKMIDYLLESVRERERMKKTTVKLNQMIIWIDLSTPLKSKQNKTLKHTDILCSKRFVVIIAVKNIFFCIQRVKFKFFFCFVYFLRINGVKCGWWRETNLFKIGQMVCSFFSIFFHFYYYYYTHTVQWKKKLFRSAVYIVSFILSVYIYLDNTKNSQEFTRI